MSLDKATMKASIKSELVTAMSQTSPLTISAAADAIADAIASAVDIYAKGALCNGSISVNTSTLVAGVYPVVGVATATFTGSGLS
jgi:hypothetical protein